MRLLSIIFLSFVIVTSFLQAQPVDIPQHGMMSRLDILPSGTVSMVAGSALRFTAVAYNRQNMAYTPNYLNWSADGGTIMQDGTFTAGNYGYGRVTVRAGQMTASVSVQIRSFGPNISRILINPENITINTNSTYQFRAVAYDRQNNVVNTDVVWSANGGQIDQNGFYRSSFQQGTFQITARDSNSGIQGIAQVRVSGGYNPTPQPYPHPQPGGNARIVISNYDIGGNFFKPKIKVTAQVYGYNIQTIRLFSYNENGRYEEIDAQSCRDGATVNLSGTFDRFGVKHIEIRLYNNYNQEIAKETRQPN